MKMAVSAVWKRREEMNGVANGSASILTIGGPDAVKALCLVVGVASATPPAVIAMRSSVDMTVPGNRFAETLKKSPTPVARSLVPSERVGLYALPSSAILNAIGARLFLGHPPTAIYWRVCEALRSSRFGWLSRLANNLGAMTPNKAAKAWVRENHGYCAQRLQIPHGGHPWLNIRIG
jgi:hypothetical protein